MKRTAIKSIAVTLLTTACSLMLSTACGQATETNPYNGGKDNGSGFDPGTPGDDGQGEGQGETTFVTTFIGANFNEHVEEIAGVYKELNATGTEYIRSFINITSFLTRNESSGITGINASKLNSATQPAQFVAVKSSVPKAKMVLSIKIVFENLPGQVPARGTAGANHVIDCIRQLLEKENLGGSVDVLVLGNEPMWENGDNAANPQNYAGFITDLAAAAKYWKANKGWKYKIFAGALNRVSIQDPINANVGAIINAAAASPDIDGLDIHMHNDEVSECEASLKVVRNKYKFTKELMCSEVSMVWKLNDLMKNNLGNWGTNHGYSSTMKRYEWLNQVAQKAKAGTPISADEFNSFFIDGMVNYPRNWFTTFFDNFLKYEVSFVTPRFSAEESDTVIDSETTMWELGAIFSARFLGRAADGTMSPSPLVYPEVEACRLRKK